MASSSENPPLRRQAAWVVGWRIVGILATLASNILAARLLGPSEFGIYLLVTTIIALGGVMGAAGLNEAGLRFVAENLAMNRHNLARAYLRRTLTTIAVTSLLAAGIMAVSVGMFQLATPRFEHPLWVIVLTALGVVALTWQLITAESLRGFGELRLASLFSGGQTGGPISNLFLLAGLLAATLWVSTIHANLAIGLTVLSIGMSLPFALTGLWQTSHKAADKASVGIENDLTVLSPNQSRELFAVSSILLLNQLLAFVSQQLDVWLGGALLTPEALGLYGAAKRSLLLAAMPVQMAMMTVVATIPRLYAQQRTRELERVIRTASNYAAIPALCALLMLMAFPESILQLVFGGSYTGAAPTVMVLTTGYLALVLFGNPPHVLTMTGRHQTVLVINAIAAIVLVVVGDLGAKLYGAPGLAAGSALSFAFQNASLWWLAKRKLDVWTHVGPSFPSVPSPPMLAGSLHPEHNLVGAVVPES